MSVHLFDRLEERTTGAQRPDDLWGAPLCAKMDSRETGEIRPYTVDRCTEHELTLRIAVKFWANRAQYCNARNVAERALATLLYHDVLGKLSQIEHAVMDSDGHRAFAACGELRQMLTR